MKDFKIHIFATNKVYYDGNCQSLVLPTSTGKLGIMAGRANLVTLIKPGVAKLTINEEEVRKVYLGPGLIKVENGEVTILVEMAENPDELESIMAQKEVDREKELKRQQDSLKEYRLIQARLAMTAQKLKESSKETL